MAHKVINSDPRFDFSGLTPAHINTPITDISLCAHFEFCGVCDERTDLSFRPKRGDHGEPPRANHFSIWLGLGGTEAVVMDVIQPGYPFNPYASEDYLGTDSCVVRLFSETYPSSLDFGCVYQEHIKRKEITIAHIIDLIVENERQGYLFLSDVKQKVGCRYWIYIVSKDLERAGIVSRGHGDTVLKHLQRYYGKFPVREKVGKWANSDTWAERPDFKCPEIQQGVFPSAKSYVHR